MDEKVSTIFVQRSMLELPFVDAGFAPVQLSQSGQQFSHNNFENGAGMWLVLINDHHTFLGSLDLGSRNEYGPRSPANHYLERDQLHPRHPLFNQQVSDSLTLLINRLHACVRFCLTQPLSHPYQFLFPSWRQTLFWIILFPSRV